MVCKCPFCNFECSNQIRPYVCQCGAVLGKNGWITKVTVQRDSGESAMSRNHSSIQAGRQAWSSLHMKQHGTPEFLVEWKQQIPEGCACRKQSETLFEELPPDFSTPDSWFEWTVRFHNAVNSKLGKPAMDIEVARRVWRHSEKDADASASKPIIDDWMIVTSLSVLPNDQEVQQRCLQSWRRLGVRIVSGNLASQIEALKASYQDVEFVAVRPSDLFDRPTARIYDLMRIGGDLPRLLINSDIEILGDGSRISEAACSGRALAGIRHNWIDHRGNAYRENWELDAFLLSKKHVDTFPDIDFAIGQPMWDWWIPFHLNLHGISIDWVGEPYFYHASHTTGLDKQCLPFARGIMKSLYETPASDEYWTRWRRAQPFHDLAGTFSVDCKYFNKGYCNLATKIAGTKLPIVVQEATCKTCIAMPNPMSINKVTCTLALTSLVASSEFNSSAHSNLMECANVRTDEKPESYVDRPGSALRHFMSLIGITEPSSCYCEQYAKKMDVWGYDGCRERQDEIVEYLNSQSEDWFDLAKLAEAGYASTKAIVDQAVAISNPDQEQAYEVV